MIRSFAVALPPAKWLPSSWGINPDGEIGDDKEDEI